MMLHPIGAMYWKRLELPTATLVRKIMTQFPRIGAEAVRQKGNRTLKMHSKVQADFLLSATTNSSTEENHNYTFPYVF